jgi:fatty-acyl-CoA synthase
LLSNCNEFLEAYFGLAKIGAVIVPLNPRLTSQELEYICRDSGIKGLIFGVDYAHVAQAIKSRINGLVSVGPGEPAWAKNCEFVAQHPPTEPKPVGGGDETAVLLYSAGTMGGPKGVPTTHQALLWWLAGLMMNLDFRPEGRVLVVVPVYHGIGLNFALASVFKGCTTILMNAFDPVKVLETIRDEKIDMLPAVPTILEGMSQAPNFETYFRSVHTVVTGGSPLSARLLQTFMRQGIKVHNFYGQTEAGNIGFSDGSQKASIVPLFYDETRVVDGSNDVARGDLGEILVRGPTLMKGYWNNAEASHKVIKDGWLHTGDIGRIDENGCILIIGRKDDMIISGSEHVHPTEIENLLCSNSKIAEAAVFGQPDKVWGEMVCAVVRPKEGEAITAKEVTEFCDGKVARFKIPKRVIVTNEPLPRNAAGKVLRRTLREQLIPSMDERALH